MSNSKRNQYKIAGPATWELIRAAYLGGESARALAERFGVSEHAIRKRITVEKWSKRAYAAALEARGVVREKQKPNFIEEGVLREEMRVAAEALAAAEREAEMNALVEQIASEEDAAGIAAAIERRALAQAGAAMVQGRSKEAQALAAMAEMMRKRAAMAAAAPAPAPVIEQAAVPQAPATTDVLVAEDAPELSTTEQAAELERRALAQVAAALEKGRAGDAKALAALAEQMRKRVREDTQVREVEEARVVEVNASLAKRTEAELVGAFRYSAFLAYCMLHNPKGAPAIFTDAIAELRREAFGEGDEESIAKARAEAEYSRRYFGLDEDAWEEAWAQHSLADYDGVPDPEAEGEAEG